MRSSTSSSETSLGGTCQSYWPTVCNMAITLVCLAAAAWARPYLSARVQTGLPESLFFEKKILSTGPYQVVLAGDSRVYRGLAPEEIGPVLGIPAAQVLNFGFSSCAYEPRYLDAIDGMLAAEESTLVLCLDANSFFIESLKSNGFLDHLAGHAGAGWIQRWQFQLTLPIRRFAEAPSFQRLKGSELAGAWRRGFQSPRPSRGYHASYLDTGWVASRVAVPRLDYYHAWYRKKFRGDCLDQEAIARLAACVRKWSSRGIRVVALRMPIDAELRRLEDRSGLDWPALRRRLEKAGATWLVMPSDDYATYDGSHLDADSARRFSRDLALALQGLSRPSPEPPKPALLAFEP